MHLPALPIHFALAALLSSAVLPHGKHGAAPQASTAASGLAARLDSVDFTPLEPRASQRDCAPDDSMPTPCRIRRGADRALLENVTASGGHVIQSGDEVTFVTRSNAKSMQLQGGLQYPMSRVVGTDLWTITMRVPDASRAIVSYFFFSPDTPMAPGTKVEFTVWRGPAAPAAARKSTAIKGTIRVDTVPSRFLSAPRSVISYTPPAVGNQRIAGVVYMGDGGSLQSIAPYLDTLVVTGQLPRIMLVGIETGFAGPNDPPGTDVRSMEYLMDYERGNARFLAHEHHVFDEVMPWAEAKLGAPRDRERRAVWGISNSGGWAVTMGLRHPDVLGVVLAFSPGGSHGTIPDGARFTPSVRFMLYGGTLEPNFRRVASDWNDTLRTRGITARFEDAVAGHDFQVWAEHFPGALRWAWGRDERQPGVGTR